MPENINTKEYWENRFSSNDWVRNRGRWQTESFARAQVEHFEIPSGFEGEILDFGCGLGDAMPVYRRHFPNAKLIGIDISHNAIDKCNEEFGGIASFLPGVYRDVPNTDVIIASSVFEHLSNDREIARHLLSKCESLYITVPYKEHPLYIEHINAYDETYFQGVGSYDFRIFPCLGWTQYGVRGLWYNVYLKNIFRYCLGRPVVRRNMQIMFRFLTTCR